MREAGGIPVNKNSTMPTKQDKSQFYYSLIGINAGLALLLIYYWLLLQTSSLTAFYDVTNNDPFYFWTYTTTTIVTVVLFGVNVALAVYLYRRTKTVTVRDQSGTVIGGAAGAFAAACPVCGAFLLSLIGVSGGLATLPFKGLEIKIISLAFIILSLYLIAKRIKHPLCKDGKCPAPETVRFGKRDLPLLLALGFLLVALLWIGWGMLQTEPFISNI